MQEPGEDVAHSIPIRLELPNLYSCGQRRALPYVAALTGTVIRTVVIREEGEHIEEDAAI